MSFMQPQVCRDKWCEIDTDTGTWWVPADQVTSTSPDALIWFCEATHVHEHKFIEGWGARLSAPGYLDCTPWVVFETQKEAQEYINEMLFEDEGDSDESSHDADSRAD